MTDTVIILPGEGSSEPTTLTKAGVNVSLLLPGGDTYSPPPPLTGTTGTIAQTLGAITQAATGTPIDDAAWHSTEADDVFAATVYVAVEGPWISTDTEDVLDVTGGPVSFDGPWHSTATKDVFAATGGPYPGGPWNSTATKDVFAATGYVPSIGLWHSTAKKDVFDATGYAPSVASWHSTEATDIFVSPTPASWASTEAPDRLAAAAYTPGESMEWVSTEPVDMVNATGYITDLGSWASPEAKDIFSAIGAGASAPKGRRIFLAC